VCETAKEGTGAAAAGPPRKVDLREKFSLFGDLWHPRIVAQVDGMQVKVVRLRGEFDWHRHENDDELFLVVGGSIRIDFRDREVWLEEGELLVVPHGVEHRPVAPREARVLLIERAGVLNTGDVRSERTVEEPDWI
jgi:mannose-6-phosphate isomerase-like protein (cupin superfamily)